MTSTCCVRPGVRTLLLLLNALEVLSLLLLKLLPITLLSPMSLPVGALPSIKEPVISPKKFGALDASLPSVPALNVLSFSAPSYSSTLLSSTWLKEPSLLPKAQSILPMPRSLGMPLHSMLSLVELSLSAPSTTKYLTAGLQIPQYPPGSSSPCSVRAATLPSAFNAPLIVELVMRLSSLKTLRLGVSSLKTPHLTLSLASSRKGAQCNLTNLARCSGSMHSYSMQPHRAITRDGCATPFQPMSAGVISCGQAALSCTTRHRMAMRHRRLCRKGERSARARFLAKG